MSDDIEKQVEELRALLRETLDALEYWYKRGYDGPFREPTPESLLARARKAVGR